MDWAGWALTIQSRRERGFPNTSFDVATNILRVAKDMELGRDVHLRSARLIGVVQHLTLIERGVQPTPRLSGDWKDRNKSGRKSVSR